MAAAGLPHVVRFPIACSRCAAHNVMPSKAGTLAQHRTQVHLKCENCRHEWSVEMIPPVVLVKRDRKTDDDSGNNPHATAQGIHAADRRKPYRFSRQRMRAGLCGLLRPVDRTQTVAVLYSLDARQAAGRLRPLDPRAVFPGWLVPGSRLWLTDYDGAPRRIRVTAVRAARDGPRDGEQFAEYVLAQGAP